MTERETVNARISGTTLGIEDHGIMTFFVHLEWRGAGQGLGGYALDQCVDYKTDERKSDGCGILAIRKILEVVGVEKWEELSGKLVRLKIGTVGSSTQPIIGHIIEDRWFDLAAFMRGERDV